MRPERWLPGALLGVGLLAVGLAIGLAIGGWAVFFLSGASMSFASEPAVVDAGMGLVEDLWRWAMLAAALGVLATGGGAIGFWRRGRGPTR